MRTVVSTPDYVSLHKRVYDALKPLHPKPWQIPELIALLEAAGLMIVQRDIISVSDRRDDEA